MRIGIPCWLIQCTRNSHKEYLLLKTQYPDFEDRTLQMYKSHDKLNLSNSLYFPHHAVYCPESKSTKTRVVFMHRGNQSLSSLENLTRCHSIEGAVQRQKQLVQSLKPAGFLLKKIASINSRLLEAIPEYDVQSMIRNFFNFTTPVP